MTLLALAFAALSLTLTGGGLALHTVGGTMSIGWGLLFVATVVVFSTVGALIVSRQPRNPIGWLFCGVAVLQGAAPLASGYAAYWLAGNAGSATLAHVGAWYSSTSWILSVIAPAMFVMLLFPDGRALSPRWRVLGWCGGIGLAIFFVSYGAQPGPLEDFPMLSNPFAIDSPARAIIAVAAASVILIVLVGAPLSLALRFRRASSQQRLQIKWLLWAGALAVATLGIGAVAYDVLTPDVANAAIMLTLLGIPIATGIAILRYRLYDIDLVINRTLVYASLTVALGAAYLGSVLLLQLALRPLTQGSGLAVAASTLAAAALFRPLRSRIQAVVDRRFYRRKYDAARTIENFGVHLRHEFDLETLAADLRGVVHDTMRPAHVSLWLRRTDR